MQTTQLNWSLALLLANLVSITGNLQAADGGGGEASNPIDIDAYLARVEPTGFGVGDSTGYDLSRTPEANLIEAVNHQKPSLIPAAAAMSARFDVPSDVLAAEANLLGATPVIIAAYRATNAATPDAALAQTILRQVLVDRPKRDLDARASNGDTALLTSLRQRIPTDVNFDRKVATVKQLLAAGADAISPGWGGMTPLQVAFELAKSDPREKDVEMLLETAVTRQRAASHPRVTDHPRRPIFQRPKK